MRRNITIEDVGKAAGVSRQTVSRVINGQPNVSAAARERVEAAIAELGYVPNPAARRMGGGRSFILLALLDRALVQQRGTTISARMPLDAMLLEGVRICSAQGYRLVFEQLDGASDGAPQAVAKLLMELAPDGVILLPPLEHSMTLRGVLAARDIPSAALGEHREFGRPAPGLDDHGQGEAAALHCIARGHRQIAFVAGGGEQRQSQARLAGYRRALAKVGSRAHRHFVSEIPLDYSGARRLAQTWLVPTIRPTAVIADTAEVALAFLEAARALGRSVPRDISLITLEDRPAMACVEPAITALTQDYTGLFMRACAMLMREAGASPEGDADSAAAEPGPSFRLIERGSVAKAPRAV